MEDPEVMTGSVGLLFADPGWLSRVPSVLFDELELLVELGKPGLLSGTVAVYNNEPELLAIPVELIFDEPRLLIEPVGADIGDCE